MNRRVFIDQFLTPAQVRRVFELKTAKEICAEVIEPNMAEINRKLCQQNVPMYLAYACELAVSQSKGKP